MKFRKKPVVIEAIQWDGQYNRMKFPVWFNAAWSEYGRSDPGCVWIAAGILTIGTLEGPMFANKGDWIIRGVKGELYPCKPDIFEATYERVES